MKILLIIFAAIIPMFSFACEDEHLPQCSTAEAAMIIEHEEAVRKSAAMADVVQGLNRYGVSGDPVTYVFSPKGHPSYPSEFKIWFSKDKVRQTSGVTASNQEECNRILCEIDVICSARNK